MKLILTYRINSEPEKEDILLENDIQQVLEFPLDEYIKSIVEFTRLAIKGRTGEELSIRCFRTKKWKQGSCFKNGGNGIPHIILGFNGNCEDFTISLIHELLHLFRWDEKMVETKAKKIYKKRAGLCYNHFNRSGGN